MNNNKSRQIRRRPRRALITSSKPIDPIFTPRKINIRTDLVPDHIVSPSVTRIVRILNSLTSTNSTYTLTYNKIALQDAQDYTSTNNLRYSSCRVTAVRAWAESPNALAVAQNPYGLGIQESVTGFEIFSRPISGSRICAVHLSLPFSVRSSIAATSSTTAICVLFCDQTIATSTDFDVAIDATVEFMS